MMSLSTADLWDRYSDRLTYLNLNLFQYGGRDSFHGKIVTLKVFEDNTYVRELLSKEGKGKVLVVDGGGSSRCALVGDSIAQLAIDNGWEGLLVYGSIRDSLVIRTMKVSILALGTCPVKSIKRDVGYPGEPLIINGTEILEGQYMYADSDGVLIANEDLLLESPI